MKIYWSTFLSLTLLLTLVGCGAEQFGTIPQANKENPTQVSALTQASCANHTLIKPEVDILYVVDNSTSSYYLASDIKNAIQNTINKVSSQFDYRLIGTPLIETATGNEDYQVLSKSDSSLPSSVPTEKRVTSAAGFSFFQNLVTTQVEEKGLSRIQSFISYHSSSPLSNDGLFRQGAHLIVVLISNGRDTEVEYVKVEDAHLGANAPTYQHTTEFNARRDALLLNKSYLNSQQLRLLSVTANTRCVSGYQPSTKSYAAMSQALYDNSNLPSKSNADHYDLCSSSNISGVFTDLNAQIQQIILPHTYKKWPITFAEPAAGINFNDLRVYKSSPTTAPTLMPSSSYTLVNNPGLAAIDTRSLPTPGEPSNARYLIEFTNGNEIVYPACVQISSSSNVEYFGFVALEKNPKQSSVILKINGVTVPQSSTSGWSFFGYAVNKNIKVNPSTGAPQTPEVKRTGFFLKLNGSSNYYKSGDSVTVDYVPDGV